MRTFTPETPAVIAHLEMLQSVIQRLAENSRSCKVWSITALSGVLFFAARTAIPWHTLIALVPLALFFLLDVYYLSLERRSRGSYESMLGKLQGDAYGPEDVFQIVPVDFTIGILVKCLGSPSVYLYYPIALGITVALFAAQCTLGMGTDAPAANLPAP